MNVPRTPLRFGLPRRVVVYHLFFSVAAICWVAIGVVVATQMVLTARTENTCLAQLGQAAANIEVEYLRNGTARLADLVALTKAKGNFKYCAIVGDDGSFVAHTNQSLAGQAAQLPTGVQFRWGNVSGVRYTDEHNRPAREYRLPLEADRQHIGYLHAGVLEPGIWGTLSQVAAIAPLVVFVPLIFVGGGAWVLFAQARPMARIESELRRIAHLPLGDAVNPQPQAPSVAASIGWNRLVDTLDVIRQQGQQGSMDERLALMTNSNQSGSDSILMQLPEGIALTDTEGRVTKHNAALAVLLGLDADGSTLTGDRLEEHFPPTDSGKLAQFADSSNRQRSVIVELNLADDDCERFIRAARHPWRHEDGALAGYAWMVRDVTQQKMSERMRDQFIDTATHELRTPLANIKAYAETLKSLDETDIESQREFSNTINSEATRLGRFVDDLLSLSSIEVGSLAIDRHTVDMERLLDEVVSKVEPLMRQKSLQFEVSIPAKVSEVLADKDKMIATLVNLLGNAAKYTPEEGRVSLRVKQADDQLQISIEDTGVGIAAEELEKVFEKFFRSGDPRIADQVGTGLGLSLAREIARLHGGDIEVISEINKGSTFTLTVPLSSR